MTQYGAFQVTACAARLLLGYILALMHNVSAFSAPGGVSERPNACLHAQAGAVGDSGRPAAAGPAKMAIWAIIFHQPPLEVAWGGTCAVPIAPCLGPISRYVAGIHLHRRLIRLVCPTGKVQCTLSLALSRKIRSADIIVFRRHHGPMARAACGGSNAVGRP